MGPFRLGISRPGCWKEKEKGFKRVLRVNNTNQYRKRRMWDLRA